MRRNAGLVMIALGACLLLLAPLMKFWAGPALVKTPLDTYSVTTAEANNGTYLDLEKQQVMQGRKIRATRTVRGDVKASNKDVAVWDVFVKTMDLDRPGQDAEQLVNASTDRVAFNRRSSEAVDCCGANVNKEPIKHEGIEYKFPFGAEKKTYQYFDTSIGRAKDMEFVGEEQIEGVKAYHYQQKIAPTKIADIDVPGSLIGETGNTVSVERIYSVDRNVWVEPQTGMIIKGAEKLKGTLNDRSGAEKLVITDFDLVWTPDTIKAQAKAASDKAGQANVVTNILPIVALILGLGLIVAGVLMVMRGEGGGSGAPKTGREPEYV